MTFLDLYFDETNEEFDFIHSRIKNLVTLKEDDSFIKLEFNDDGTQINILEFSQEDYMCYLSDAYLLNELYCIIKNNFSTENWLFILIQVIFDLTYLKDYPSIKKFIMDHIYDENTSKSFERNNKKLKNI